MSGSRIASSGGYLLMKRSLIKLGGHTFNDVTCRLVGAATGPALGGAGGGGAGMRALGCAVI